MAVAEDHAEVKQTYDDTQTVGVTSERPKLLPTIVTAALPVVGELYPYVHVGVGGSYEKTRPVDPATPSAITPTVFDPPTPGGP